MNSPNPQSKDELDCLVREALEAWVGSQEPPERVWKRIKLELTPGRLPPRRSRTRWLSLAVQSVLCLLLVMLGIAGLGMPWSSEGAIPATERAPSTTAVYHDSKASTVLVPAEPDLDLLKTFNRPARQAAVNPQNRPSETSLLERRLLRAEPSLPFHPAVQERMVVFTKPYED